MRAVIFMVVAACASGKDMAPMGSAEAPKADQVAMGGAPAPRAAGDPCEGGQVAPAAERAPEKPTAIATAAIPESGGTRGGGPGQGAPAGDGIGGLSGIRGPDVGTGAGAGGLRARTTQPSPRVALGTVQVDGTYEKEIVRRIVMQHVAQLRYCYENTLKKTPTLNGLVVIHFEIDGSGAVPTAEVTKSLEGELDACFIGRIKALEFPKPEKGTVKVQLPLNLSQGY